MKAYFKITFLSFLFFCLLGFGNINLKLNPYYFNGISLDNNIPELFTDDIGSSESRAISITTNQVLASTTGGASAFSSIPKTIVNTAYDISGNSGRKIVLLDNGWLVAATKYSNSGYLYISKDNGITWSQLCMITSGFYGSYSITSYGTKVYVIGNTSTVVEKVWVIDAETQANVNIETTGIVIDSAQSGFGSGCSITADDNGVLHAIWNSRNSLYPNSFNLRYSKSGDYGLTWSAPDQLTNINVSGTNITNPSIMMRNNVPVIVCEGDSIAVLNQSVSVSSNMYSIITAVYDEVSSKWIFYNTYSLTGYNQDYPSACITRDGNIHIAWHGKDSINSGVDNIKYSMSSDGGTTWSLPIKITTENSYTRQYPSLTCDRDNNLFIYIQGTNSSGYNYIWKSEYLNGSWSNPIQVSNNINSHTYYPQTVYDKELDLYNGEPLMMWMDSRSGVYFKGKLPEWYNSEIDGTVANGAYKIFGSTGKKIIKLKNGILISALQDVANHKIMLYKSENNGATWVLVKEDIQTTSIQDVVLTELNDGNLGYLLLSNSNNVSFKKISGINYEYLHQVNISNTQSNVGVCSIALGSDGALHAVWSGLANSCNMWYSKSIDSGITWESPTPILVNGARVTTNNPCIVINKNNEPVVLFGYSGSHRYKDELGNTVYEPFSLLGYMNKINGVWTSIKALQSNESSSSFIPTVIIDTSGTIHCVWNVGSGLLYSSSTDGSNTWSNPVVISNNLINPSLTSNKDNDVFVLGSSTANSPQVNINMIKRTASGTWSSSVMLTNNTTASADYPQTIHNQTQSFQIPEFIYQDNQVNSIKFQSMLTDTTPLIEIVTPTSSEVISLNNKLFQLKIKIKDDNNETLECKYYMDNEIEPRETKLESETCILKEISFLPIDISSLLQGEHRIKAQVSNKKYTNEAMIVFYIDNEQPLIGSNVISTDTSLTIYASASDTGNLNSIPYRYSIGEVSGEWTADTSYTWDNLKPDTLYSITFETRDDAGNISSFKKDIYTKSQTPELSVSNITSQSLDLNITDNNPETTQYQINVGAKYIDENGKLTETPSWISIASKKLSISGLTPNSKYTFTAKTKNSEDEESQYSVPLEIETLGITLSMPINITISASATYNLVTWDAVEGAIEYEVEADGLVKVLKTTTFKHTGLVPNTQHTYRIRAKNYYGYSDWSVIETGMTGSSMPVGAANINAFPSNTAVVLTWNAIEDAQSYEVEFDGKVIDNGLNTFCTKAGLLPESSHTYRVRAINAAGEGTWSEIGSVTTYLLDTPSGFEIVEDEAEVKLAWSAVDKATEYEIEVNGSTILTTSEHAYVHTGLTPETTYLYRIKAKNSNGESSWSSIISAVTLPVRPKIPANIAAHSIQNIITMTWDAVDGAIAYDVELDGILIDNGNSTVYVHEDLSSYTLHTYRIRAKNEAVEGKWSELLNIKTMEGKPKYPGKILVDSTTTITTLSWEGQNDALAYDVEVDGEIIENITKPTYTHRRITPGTEHLYRIRTRNLTGTSSWSGYVINNALRAVCKKDKDLDLGLTASDIIDFSKYTLKVTYNPDVIEVMDLSTLSSRIELKEGKIEGTGITITSFKPGEIVFVVDKSIPPGESWSGVINSIKFRAKVSGGTNITYTVYGRPEDIE